MTIKQSNITSLFEMSPNFAPPFYLKNSFENYVGSLQELLETVLSKIDIHATHENRDKIFLELTKALPIIHYSDLNENSNSFSFAILCNGQFTHGIGRFIGDMLSKCLVPGSQLTLRGNRSLNFNFVHFPNQNLFFTEYFVHFEKKDFHYLIANMDHFTKQLRLTILAVYYARSIVSTKSIPEEEKASLVAQNISSLLGIEEEIEPTAFDHMQNFLVKLSAEKNLSQIKSNLNGLINKYPSSFDWDIFDSIHNVSQVFSDLFTANRDPKFVSRLISSLYLFKKMAKQKNTASERLIRFKLFKSKVLKNRSQIMGVLLTLSLIEEKERFDQAHMLQSLKSLLGDIRYVKSSFISDKRDPKCFFFYLEIEKENLSNFTLSELKTLKKHLISEIEDRIEKRINPIFMPRNEEEIIRNIIVLSKQLKYVKDIPQLIITYEKQSEEDISFLVIMVRLLKEDSLPLKEHFSYFQTFLKFISDEVKILGSLKKKYPKEANVFRVLIKKTAFYRKDFSLDLQKARQTVVSELAKIFGDFRDYNGGMILKQNQALDSLKQLLASLDKKKAFLVENFFYSIKPGIMQSIIDPKILKTFFLLFNQALETNFSEKPFVIKTISMPKYLLLVIGSCSSSFKEQIENTLSSLKIASFDLTSGFLQEEGITALGYIYRTSNLTRHAYFSSSISNAMKKWEKSLEKELANL